MALGKKPFHGWWVLAAGVTVLTNGFALSAFALPVFYPELVQTFGWSRATIALGGSLKTLLVGIIAPINGWFIDRRGAKSMILAGIGVLAVSWVLFSGVNELWMYFVLCLLLGVGGSWTHYMPVQLLIASWFEKKRGLVMGILNGGAGLGQALIAMISGELIQRVGWSRASLLLPVVLLLPLAAVAVLVRSRPQDMGLFPDGATEPPDVEAVRSNRAAQSQASSNRLFRTARYWMVAIVLLLSAWAEFSVWQHFVLFFRDKGFEPRVAAFLFSMFLATSTVGCLVSGPLCDRLSARTTTFLSFLCVIVSIVSLPFTAGFAAALTCVIIYGLGYGGTVTVRPLLIFEYFGSAAAGRLYGVATATFTVGAFVGPILAGYIHDTTHSYNAAYLLAFVLMCLAMCLLHALKWTRNPFLSSDSSAT